jgi:hypothetical protein
VRSVRDRPDVGADGVPEGVGFEERTALEVVVIDGGSAAGLLATAQPVGTVGVLRQRRPALLNRGQAAGGVVSEAERTRSDGVASGIEAKSSRAGGRETVGRCLIRITLPAGCQPISITVVGVSDAPAYFRKPQGLTPVLVLLLVTATP